MYARGSVQTHFIMRFDDNCLNSSEGHSFRTSVTILKVVLKTILYGALPLCQIAKRIP